MHPPDDTPPDDAPPPHADDAARVTYWLGRLKAGDPAAAQPLWENYFARLVRLLHARMPVPGVLDHEGIAASAFRSFWDAARRGRFPRLDDRHDLWKLLVTITARKAADQLDWETAQKRGGGMARADAAVLESVISREPTPEEAATVAEEFARLLTRLDDDRLRQIAVWKMEGCTSREIGDRLGCALRTVANKLELIRKILQAES